MKNTALLVMDYQGDILKTVEAKLPSLLKNAKSLVDLARETKVEIVYVRVGFRSGYPEVHPKNKMFGSMAASGRLQLGTPGTEIHPDVAPRANEAVVTKHRVGPFNETDLRTILRAKEICTLYLAGVSTSGVVLSSVRVAADMDFEIFVVSDACTDTDDEVHRLLMEKVFPKQTTVVTTAEVLKSRFSRTSPQN